MPVDTCSFSKFFDKYTVATTGWTYNDSGGASATAGWKSARYNELAVQTCVATHSAGTDKTVVWRIEGKYNDNDRAASIYIFSKTAANPIDQIYRVTEKVKQIRLGVRLGVMVGSLAGSAVIVYAGVGRTEYR
jgi:hypothetical protein